MDRCIYCKRMLIRQDDDWENKVCMNCFDKPAYKELLSELTQKEKVK